MPREHPNLKIELTFSDKILEWLAVAGLVAMWFYTVYLYTNLPETIPIHFDLKGNIDDWGNKETIWLLPIIASILFAGLTALTRYPELHYHHVTDAPAFQENHYRLSTQLIRVIKLNIVFIFIFCLYEIQKGAADQKLPYQAWILPVIVSLVVIPAAFYIYRSFKNQPPL